MKPEMDEAKVSVTTRRDGFSFPSWLCWLFFASETVESSSVLFCTRTSFLGLRLDMSETGAGVSSAMVEECKADWVKVDWLKKSATVGEKKGYLYF